MSYSSIKEKIDSGKVVILDGGIGGELERNGASMDKGLWCGKCSVENPELVLNDYDDIRQNFIRLVKEAINNGSYVGIATHDDFVIDNLYEWIIQNNISKNQFEFQVLHGVPMKKKLKKLMNEGNTVRVYLPYGDNWYDYSVRRLKENPKMAGYIIKNLFLSIFRIK